MSAGAPTGARAARANLSDRPGPAPYLVVGLVWFVFLLFALVVPLIEPVFLWVMTQGLLVEKVVPATGGWWISRVLLLVAYMAAGLIAWWLVERPDADPRRVWRRAAIAWIGIQLIYCVTATILVKTGVLYE